MSHLKNLSSILKGTWINGKQAYNLQLIVKQTWAQ